MSDRHKELKEAYKQAKQPMGIIIIKCKAENKCYIEATMNIKGAINKNLFSLRLDSHMNKNLKAAWLKNGEDAFVVEVLDTLEYEDNKDDYKDDLKLLYSLWCEILTKEQNLELY